MAEGIDPRKLAKDVLADVAHNEGWNAQEHAVGEAIINTTELKNAPIPEPTRIEAAVVKGIEARFPAIRLGYPKDAVRGMGDNVGIYLPMGSHQEDIYSPDLPGKPLRFTVDNLTEELQRRNFNREG